MYEKEGLTGEWFTRPLCHAKNGETRTYKETSTIWKKTINGKSKADKNIIVRSMSCGINTWANLSKMDNKGTGVPNRLSTVKDWKTAGKVVIDIEGTAGTFYNA